MNDLRKAAEMALEALEWNYGTDLENIENCTAWLDKMNATIQALRQALDDKPPIKTYCGGKANYCTPEETPEVTPEVTGEVTGEVQCKTHPDAPHGFDRNASHSADRYVCECESWEPVDAVNMTQDRVDETSKGEQEPFIYIREDTEMPFGGYEHCGQHEAGAFPVYLAPPKQEYQYEVVAEHADGTYTTKRIPKRQWVGLTADEIWKCNKAKSGGAVEFHVCSAHQNLLDFAEAIEAKLKEKNGG